MTAKGSGLEPSLRVPRARSHSRISVESIAYVELCDKVGGLILNVSESGLAVQVAEKLVVQSFARLRFQLHKSDEWIETAGKLVWNNPSTKEAGIKFVNLPEASRALIKKWVLAEALRRELPKLKGRFELKRDPEIPPSAAASPSAAESRVAPPPDVSQPSGDPGSARLREAMSRGSFLRDGIPNQQHNQRHNQSRDEINPPKPQPASSSPSAPFVGSRSQQSPAAQIPKSIPDPRISSATRDAELRAKLGINVPPPSSRTYSKVLTGAIAVIAFLLLMLFGTGTWTPAFLRRAPLPSPSATESPAPLPSGPAKADVNSATDSPSHPSSASASEPAASSSSKSRSSAISPTAIPANPSRTHTAPIDSDTTPSPRANPHAPSQSPASVAATSARSVQPSEVSAPQSSSTRNIPVDSSAVPPARAFQPRVNASPRASSITHAAPPAGGDPVAAIEATSRFHSVRLSSDAASQSAAANQNARIGELISSNQPWYPADAARQHVQGVVRLRAIVNRSGAVESVSVISGPQALIQPSINAARQWQFGQSFLGDQPIEVEQDITFVFTLPDDVASNK